MKDKFYRILISIIFLEFLIFSFVVMLTNNIVFLQISAQQLHYKTLEEIAKQKSGLDKTAVIDVGDNPLSIGVDVVRNTVYVANSDSNTVSVISTENDTRIKDIPVGIAPYSIGIDSFNNRVYVSNYGSDSVSVISTETNTKIKDIITPLSFPSKIVIDTLQHIAYVLNSDSVSVISTENDTKIKDIPLEDNPRSIALDRPKLRLYVLNYDSVSVLFVGKNITKIKDIPLEDEHLSIDIDPVNNILYAVNSDSNRVSVISLENDTKIKHIYVGWEPIDLDIWDYRDLIYVTNSHDNTVSVISLENDTKIKDIHVGDGPTGIDIAESEGTVYVANRKSDSLSIIDAVTNKVVAGITFQIFPFHGGYIDCNGLIPPISQYFYVESGTNCIAKPNKGFEFLSWEENLKNNSTQIINISRPASALESFKDIFNIKSEKPEAKLNILKFGTFNANFKELPTPVPTEYWTGLYTIVISSIIGWFIPSIVTSITRKRQLINAEVFHKNITHLWDDKELNEKDIPSLDKIKRDLSNAYSKGKINNEHSNYLNNEISTLYHDIFKKRIDALIIPNDENKKTKQVEKIKDELADAYSKGKLIILHYNLLKEKISELEK
jgi:YVTN family beta-propeller protein